MKRLDPSQQLELLFTKSKKLTSLIYLDEALYLQELRACLLQAVKEAIFQLVTYGNQNRLNKISPSACTELHKTVEKLVSQCCSFLTVESLIDLSNQMLQENKSIKEKARKKLILRDELEEIDGFESDKSLFISLIPPLENTEPVEKLFRCLNYNLDSDIPAKANNEMMDFVDEDKGENLRSQETQPVDFDEDAYTRTGSKTSVDLFRSLFEMAEETLHSPHPPSLSDDLEDQRVSTVQPPSTKDGLLPHQPIEIILWLDSFERAITRRLRNLSHALNVALLRTGVVTSLLPIPLLDSAIEGQLDLTPVGSNLLLIPLPIGFAGINSPMDLLCLLLRSSEMEFDFPRLRRCRSRLNDLQQKLVKMERQQRYWQSRAFIQEAHKQWWGSPPKGK